jgi:hypothetical protein
MTYDPATGKYYYNGTFTVESDDAYEFTIWANDPSGNFDSEVGDFYILATSVEKGIIMGNVTSGNERIDGVLIEVYNSTGVRKYVTNTTTIAGVGGIYIILNVEPGTYTVKASKAGYEPAEKSSVTVTSDQISFVNFALEKEGDMLWLLLLLVLVVVIVLLMVFYMLWRKKKKTTSKDDELIDEIIENTESGEGID